MKAIERVIAALHSSVPGIRIEQLKTKFPGDDDGLWFVNHSDSGVEVNIESSTGDFPFLIESSGSASRIRANNLEETVVAVCEGLGIAAIKDVSAKPPRLHREKI